MKTIGLLGGTGWPSTIEYYKLLNELVHKQLGSHHSARIVLKSIDYNDIMNSYGKDPEKIADILFNELLDMYSLNFDCLMICCNSLHKYYDMVKDHIYDDEDIPVFHAVELVAEHAKKAGYRKTLLLATKSTMEDGFFADTLKRYGIDATVPELAQRDAMQTILSDELINNKVSQQSRDYFAQIISNHPDCDSVILGCTEFSLLVDASNSCLPIVNPIELQCKAAVEFALTDDLTQQNKFIPKTSHVEKSECL